ncbi:MAG: hypothetical protein GY714_21370 [Desulfobacterales bacterium]|nr:hypothetical protein [Desulfobacterales bacterium]MCP4163049.1 hypothetical protein [Deltaproteobacteria bacterium]
MSEVKINCPNLEQNKLDCDCTKESCDKKGMCCDCVRHHKKIGNLPLCLRDINK